MTKVELLESFGASVYNAMAKNGITLAHMAFVTGTSPRSFRRIIDAEVAPPANVIAKITENFGTNNNETKKIKSLGDKIVKQWGPTGSAKSRPMGTGSTYAERYAAKMGVTLNPAPAKPVAPVQAKAKPVNRQIALNLPFHIEALAKSLNISVEAIANGIVSNLITKDGNVQYHNINIVTNNK